MISCLVLVDTSTKTLYIVPPCCIPEDSATQMVGNPESLKPDSGLGTPSLFLNSLQEDVLALQNIFTYMKCYHIYLGLLSCQAECKHLTKQSQILAVDFL